MSTLLEQASLVMIPSGYKEDVVYSQIPTDGSGDLTFTRASNGTRTNSAGLVEVCPWNLLSNSEGFNLSGWTAVSNTITANSTTAPNGTTTADTFTLSAGVDAGVYQAVSGVSNNYTISVYAKYVSGDKYLFLFGPLNSQGAKIWFDIQNGTVSNQLSGFTGTIENVGDGWYKCSIYNTNQAVLDYIQFGISTTNSNRVLSNNSVSYFWGAQINLGTAKPYFPTTDRLNVPRLTYQNGGGGCPSLLLEKQSTNDLIYSEQFDNAGWSQENATSTANQTTSPDGTQNADTIVDNSTFTRHILYQTLSGNLATSRTFSLYAKQNSLRYLFMSVTNAGDSHCYSAIFDLQGGTVSATKVNGDATISASIVSAGNGWYRCIISGTMTTGTANYFPLIGTSDRPGFTGSLFANNSPNYAGSGQSLYIWGAQLEASSYATSYIGTTSSSATRVEDACYKTGISSLIGQTEGVVFWDINVEVLSATGNENLLNIDNGSFGNTIYMFKSSYVLPSVGRYKMALAYKSNDFAFYVNGVSRGTDTSGSVPATSRLQMGNGALGASDGKINELILLPTRLSNSELASLTTI